MAVIKMDVLLHDTPSSKSFIFDPELCLFTRKKDSPLFVRNHHWITHRTYLKELQTPSFIYQHRSQSKQLMIQSGFT